MQNTVPGFKRWPEILKDASGLLAFLSSLLLRQEHKGGALEEINILQGQ